MSLSLVLPPLTQLNTPYPSISYLARYLRQEGVVCEQRDLGIELFHALFSRSGLSRVFEVVENSEALPEPAWRALSLRDQHLAVIEPTIAFLQGRDTSLAPAILAGTFLPAGPRQAEANLHSFGSMGGHEAARHLATLYLAELADLITSCVDEGFALARYQAHLATSAHSFDPLYERLKSSTLIDELLDTLGASLSGEMVALSVPFPGNLYGALRLGSKLRERGCFVVMGGGYVNTELREMQDERLWSCIDALTYDDGEGPLLALIEHREGGPDNRHRTRTREGLHTAKLKRPAATYGADYEGLDLGLYLQTIDTLNPAHRLWADGRWNKITLAHGCYWKRCTFCDVNLDYIAHYEAAPIVALVDHMEEQIEATGQRGFHFVDEAAPPKLLRALALEILRRNLKLSFWGNIRFEKSYDSDLCRLLAAAGLIAVTGGLEVANERLLKRIDKGVSIEQVAHATRAFQDAGIMVHAYLMYGFPSQTTQETIDSMEIVRQLFAAGLINSAFWHRFVLTRHAPIFQRPEDFGISIVPLRGPAFAANDVPHEDPGGADHDAFDEVLPRALASWLRAEDLDRGVHTWFPPGMPRSSEHVSRIASCLEKRPKQKSRGRLIWLGGEALEGERSIDLHTPEGELTIEGSDEELGWLVQLLEMSQPSEDPLQMEDALEAFPGTWEDFEGRFGLLRELGLLIL